jgi:hypothetical protein
MRRARPLPPVISTGTPAVGVGIAFDATDEREHFMKRRTCGHMIDMRNLDEALEYDDPTSPRRRTKVKTQ